MSNINSLPLYRATMGVGADEDLNFSLSFTVSDGVTPLALDGIAFTLTVGPAAAPVCVLTLSSGLFVGGVGNGVLTAFYPAASKTAWNGTLPVNLLASDASGSPSGGSRNVDIFTGSIVSVGAAAPLALALVARGEKARIATGNIQAAPGYPTLLSAAPTSPLTGGWFLVTTAGLTIQVDTAANATGVLIIGDATGSAFPNILISGTINGSSSGVGITTAGQSVTLGAVPALSSWWMQ
jgi:hypothetical protein